MLCRGRRSGSLWPFYVHYRGQRLGQVDHRRGEPRQNGRSLKAKHNLPPTLDQHLGTNVQTQRLHAGHLLHATHYRCLSRHPLFQTWKSWHTCRPEHLFSFFTPVFLHGASQAACFVLGFKASLLRASNVSDLISHGKNAVQVDLTFRHRPYIVIFSAIVRREE